MAYAHTQAGWPSITRTDGRKVLLGTDEPRRLQAAVDRARAAQR